MSRERNRLPSLDGLRAVSIGFVLIDHSLIAAGGTSSYLYNLGPLGVRVFFVISGFLITSLLLAEQDKYGQISLFRFYFRRTLRIFPPAYAYLAVAAAAITLGLVSGRLHDIGLAAAYATDLVHAQSIVVGHTWSLSVEEQFYLLWPGLLFLAGRRRSTALLLLVVLATPPASYLAFLRLYDDPNAPFLLQRTPLINAAALAMGCLLALFRTRIHALGWYRRLLASPVWILAVAVIMVNPALSEHPSILYTVSYAAADLSIVLVLDRALTLPESGLGRVLNLAPLVRIGVWSYSLYLWQQIFLASGGFAAAWPLALRIAACFAAAWLSYTWLESPALRLREKLEGRWFPRRSTAAAPLAPTVAT